jgi:hypothetical protein
MIIGIKDVISRICKTGFIFKHKIAIIKCDYCEKIFERSYNKEVGKKKFHACSKECNNKIEGKKELSKQTCLDKFGFENGMQSPLTKEKSKKTCREKFGYDYFLQTPAIVEYTHSEEIIKKQYETKKKNNTFNISHIEKELFDMLSLLFQIEIQKKMYSQYIDIYIQNFDCYIQLDGAHWHGLDALHPLPNNTKHEKDIASKYQRDRKFDEIIIKNKLRLIRITDILFKKDKNGTLQLLEQIIKEQWFGVKYLGEEFKKLNLIDILI